MKETYMILTNKEKIILKKVKEKARYYVAKEEEEFKILNELWRKRLVIKAVSWFKKDYVFALSMDGYIYLQSDKK